MNYQECYDIKNALYALNGHALGVGCRIPFLKQF